MVRHWTPKPAIISCTRLSPTGGNSFFAAVKSFEYKIAISANFVQTVKNPIIFYADHRVSQQCYYYVSKTISSPINY